MLFVCATSKTYAGLPLLSREDLPSARGGSGHDEAAGPPFKKSFGAPGGHEPGRGGLRGPAAHVDS